MTLEAAESFAISRAMKTSRTADWKGAFDHWVSQGTAVWSKSQLTLRDVVGVLHGGLLLLVQRFDDVRLILLSQLGPLVDLRSDNDQVRLEGLVSKQVRGLAQNGKRSEGDESSGDDIDLQAESSDKQLMSAKAEEGMRVLNNLTCPRSPRRSPPS